MIVYIVYFCETLSLSIIIRSFVPEDKSFFFNSRIFNLNTEMAFMLKRLIIN